MIAKANKYNELASVFPNHVLTLDVTVEATDIWKVMSRCAQIFAAHNVSLIKLSNCANNGLSFRFDCAHLSDIARLETVFDHADSPKKRNWVITIGSRK